MMNKFYFNIILIAAISLSLVTGSCSKLNRSDYLRKGFISPPDSCKPGVYWYFMDGNMDKKAITKDLESMKEAGIGYVLFLEVNVGIPRGKVDFLSEEWQDLFTHAVRECERLGIRLILGSGPGWAGSGGPWVKPEQSMMHLVLYDTVLTGPLVFEGKIPVPKPKKPFFGEGSLTPALKELRDSWYEDVKVLAFPAPKENIRLEDTDEKALYYRAPYTSQPGVAPFILPPEKYLEITDASVNKNRIIDVTQRLKPDGTLQWTVPPGKWVVVRFGKRNNGAVTRPAPVPGLGFESDKFDTAAFRSHFDAYIGKLINRVKPVKSANGGGWTMLHIDSWEMGAQNWSTRFIDEFIKRRGYDPLLFLPVYGGFIINSKEESERFLWDVRQTANELIIENHAGFLKKLAKRNGFTLSIEPYDMNPASDIELGEVADVPMCEFWTSGLGYNSAFSCIEATSVANVTGKQVVAAEAFTADQREAWKMYPGNMKNQTDWAFAMGINRLIFHTFAHKPLGDKYLPGMTMGPYGVHWDRGQTWWPLVSEYHKYISRCQFMLSQGRNVADILYLTQEGAPNVFRPPSTALQGTDTLPDKRGYSFDACSPEYLINKASANLTKIVFPTGASYRLLILPQTPAMSPELLGKIDILLRQGAILAGKGPERSPSLTNYPICDSVVRKISRNIWGKKILYEETTRLKYQIGYVYVPSKFDPGKGNSPYELYPSYDLTVNDILKPMKIQEDFSSEGNIRFSHRTTGSREIYFISNRTGKPLFDSCYFRDGTLKAEIWDPLAGDIKRFPGLVKTIKGIGAKIKLDPYQSLFVVFYHPEDEILMKNEASVNQAERIEIKEIKGPWTVSFDTAWGGPAIIKYDTLKDWTLSPVEGIKYYSGSAKYSCTFNLPDTFNYKAGRNIFIDIGKVFNIARIKLNDRNLGIVWTTPTAIKISGVVKKGENRLEIEVINLWINRLIGDEAKPWDGIENGNWPGWLADSKPRTSGRYTFTTHRFYKEGDKLSPSGLLGPVKILVSQ